MFDQELSLAVKNRMKKHLKTSRCWHNATACLTLDPSLNNCLYVEGWATTLSKKDVARGNPPFYLEHGWIETPDGKIIDPTFAGQEDEVHYFAGLKYNVTEVKKFSRKTQERPFYASIYHYDSPEYSAAQDAAMAYSRGQV
jgi:hypothetical protein